MERTTRLSLIATACCLLFTTACVPGEHDKNVADPEPAVGRTFGEGGTDQSDSSNVEASRPIRNIESDSTDR